MRQLLPPGRLFSREPGSVLQNLLDALACEFDRASDSAADLPRQVDPAVGDESIPDWERVLGLPDDCGPAPVTLEERRRAVLGRLQSGGLLSRAFYVELARSQGYTIKIEELNRAPFRCGLGRCGDHLGTEAGIFAWTAVVQTSRRHPFRVGKSQCGEAFGSLRDPLLECILRRAAPAHTSLEFRYEFDRRLPGNAGSTTLPIEDECWWRVGQGAFGSLRIYTQEGSLAVFDELGAPLRIDVHGGEFSVADELGQSLRVALTCIESVERWWQAFDPMSGTYLNVRTNEGRLLATLEDGNRVALTAPDQPFTVLDEDGNILTIPLSAVPA